MTDIYVCTIFESHICELVGYNKKWFDLEKGHLERFKQTGLLAVHLYPSVEALCQNRYKAEQFLNKLQKYEKICENA